MRKRKELMVSILLIATLLSGCVSVPALSEEQSDKIANYSTALLLKYDANYESRLVDTAAIEEERALIEEEQKKIEEAAALLAKEEENSNPSEIDEVEVVEDSNLEIASVLGITGASVEFAYYEILDKYPEEEISAAAPVMESEEGNRLLVLHFTLTNLLETTNEVSIYDTNAKFHAVINSTNQKSLYTTLLLNDMAFYSGRLTPGEMKDLVLITKVSDEESLSIQNLSLVITINEESIRTKLQE